MEVFFWIGVIFVGGWVLVFGVQLLAMLVFGTAEAVSKKKNRPS